MLGTCSADTEDIRLSERGRGPIATEVTTPLGARQSVVRVTRIQYYTLSQMDCGSLNHSSSASESLCSDRMDSHGVLTLSAVRRL